MVEIFQITMYTLINSTRCFLCYEIQGIDLKIVKWVPCMEGLLLTQTKVCILQF